MREGGLDAPTRHAVPWQDADYTDGAKLDAELRRVFDICHGCRRCFNLCDSFPRLFDLIDDSKTNDTELTCTQSSSDNILSPSPRHSFCLLWIHLCRWPWRWQ